MQIVRRTAGVYRKLHGVGDMLPVILDVSIAALILLPLWWAYRQAAGFIPGAAPEALGLVALYIFYIVLMLALAGAGSIRLMVVGDGSWLTRFIGRPSLPLLGVLLAAALLPGIVPLAMRDTGFAARGLAAARTGAGVGLMFWAICVPWRM